MGLFDDVKIEYPLPDPEHQDWEWQTKDTPAQYMETYRVTREGRLVLENYDLEPIPPEQRNSLGLPSHRRINQRDVDTEYHGDIRVIGSPSGAWTGRFAEYRLRFTHGTLESITRLEDKPC